MRKAGAEVTVEVQQIISHHYNWYLWNLSHLLDWQTVNQPTFLKQKMSATLLL